ncbi:MAG: NAD-binding protein, partial [Acidobacteriota bacterium]|nr:NAD-binding protein [Acidobacteriota bacterium]
ELFLLTVIAICFGTAYLTSLAGVSLSLGAFLAGLLVSESRFSEHAMSEILPLQILFSATFFISVGMLLDVSFLVRNLPLVCGAIAVVLVVKILTTGISVRALGYRAPVAAASALMLAQVGEFSFVLERAGREVGLSPAGLGESGSQTFIASTVVLMVATPVLMQVGSRFASRLESKQKQTAAARMEAEPTPEDVPYMEDHVIVAGYGQAARRLVHVLRGSRIPYIITTLSPEGANEADAQELPVLRGDSSKQRTLMLAGIERAKIMVIADDEPTMAARIASVARATNPTLRIVARTRYITEIEPLTRAGVDRVVTEELESIVGLFADVLSDYRIPNEEIEKHEEAMRRGGYAALISAPSSDEQPAVVCELNNERLDSRTITIRAGAPVTEQTLAELALDERGLRLHNVRRNGEVLADVTHNSKLQVGDELLIGGDTEAFARNSLLFRSTMGEDTSSPVDATDDVHHSGIVDTEKVVKFTLVGHSNACSHTAQARDVMPSARGCEECLAMGDTWVHLRICMTCGHVGCCDSSKNKHASKHFPATNHPIISSLEPGENWNWCYADKTYI